MQKYALYSRTPDGKPQRNQKGVNRMNITKITVKKIEGQQTLRGVASVVLDDEIKIRDIKILERENVGMSIMMPNKKVADGKYVGYA